MALPAWFKATMWIIGATFGGLGLAATLALGGIWILYPMMGHPPV